VFLLMLVNCCTQSLVTANSSLAVLELRGCTPITSDASRFEINMGQQLVNSGSVEWQVTIYSYITNQLLYVTLSINMLLTRCGKL
jgi:hypothetical protein